MIASLITNKKITFAFCTYNRADRLEKLTASMRSQKCPIAFEILVVNNNSQDNTLDVLERLTQQPGAPLRFVTESIQGIVAARNRAIEEAINSDILVFIDDDETPLPGLLAAVCYSILEEGAQCVGGRIDIDFSYTPRPSWLSDELLGFLGALDHGNKSFWINDKATPIWSGNVAYDMNIFKNNPELRFDKRYDRKGNVVGGGSDAAMLSNLLDRKIRIQYNPGMCILHDVETWRLSRSYFMKLHYLSGLRTARYELPSYKRTFLGIPPFLLTQFVVQIIKTVRMYLTSNPKSLRQAMNASFALGMMIGYRLRN